MLAVTRRRLPDTHFAFRRSPHPSAAGHSGASWLTSACDWRRRGRHAQPSACCDTCALLDQEGDVQLLHSAQRSAWRRLMCLQKRSLQRRQAGKLALQKPNGKVRKVEMADVFRLVAHTPAQQNLFASGPACRFRGRGQPTHPLGDRR